MSLAEQIAEAGTISLETYRKSGEGVRTTVWVVEDGGLLYIRTDPKSGKARRIRHNPRVRVARIGMLGKVNGDWAGGEARPISEQELEKAKELFMEKYGLQIRLLHVLSRLMRRGRGNMLFLGIQLTDSEHGMPQGKAAGQ
jgi:PPOX class probable F420-dependent enzyme